MSSMPQIPGYEILQPLGGGPLTQVFAARERKRDLPCALKLLRPDWEDETTAIKLLQREARACLAVKHPHLVRLFDAHVTSPPYYLAMEQLQGESLRQQLRREFSLDFPKTVWVGRQITEALAAMHRAGFLHGDVKPDNIQLIQDGQAILLDLGFAHRPGENAAFLRAGYVLGTANYLAPEMCRQETEGDESSDVFSLGVTLYELLTGKLPYRTGSVDEVFRRHSYDPPVNIRQHLPGVPLAMANMIERMLTRRPEDRPKASAVVKQLIALEIWGLGQRRAG
ncbi:MAG: serine/threonine-protein kinase [Gemmataceae bacterium]